MTAPRVVRTRPGLPCLLLVFASCGGQDAEPLDIERLAFVPSGRTRLGEYECEVPHALLADRYEVTRAEWRKYSADEEPLPEAFLSSWTPGTESWPATGMTLFEARRFAARRSMRLPTVAEWMWMSTGARGQRWPYAQRQVASVANSAELGLGRLAPVGTFHNGRTPNTAVYDLIGNAWEWVEPELPSNVTMDPVPLEVPKVTLGRGARRGPWRMITPPIVDVQKFDFRPIYSPISPIYPDVVDAVPAYEAWAMGGSFLVPSKELYGKRNDRPFFNAVGLDPAHRASDLGLRCVIEADVYLERHAQEWSDSRYRERMLALGRSASWRRYSVALLEDLCSRPNPPQALRWLLEGARQ